MLPPDELADALPPDELDVPDVLADLEVLLEKASATASSSDEANISLTSS